MSDKKTYFESLGKTMEENPIGSGLNEKLFDVLIPDFIIDSQKYGRCPLCQYEFVMDESIMQHFVDSHLEFLYMRLSK